MKQVSIWMGVAVITVSNVFAQTKNQMATPNASEALADVKRAIDKGNAQWSEGWAKGEPAMVAAIFADDGVQLTGNGKIFKGPQQISEHQKAAMQSVDPGVKVTVTTGTVWLDGDTAYETGKYKYEYQEKGKSATDEGRYVTIWKRQKDGSWKLAMDVGVPAK
jgi:uncharacterized protein (TIGR02246 family)